MRDVQAQGIEFSEVDPSRVHKRVLQEKAQIIQPDSRATGLRAGFANRANRIKSAGGNIEEQQDRAREGDLESIIAKIDRNLFVDIAGRADNNSRQHPLRHPALPLAPLLQHLMPTPHNLHLRQRHLHQVYHPH